MVRCPSLLVVIVTTLLLGAPIAAADPWPGCGPHSLEEKVVRVFPRHPTPAGPAGERSELQCGNRYYGARRIAVQWVDGATADAAIARTLVADAAPVHDPRSDTWTFRGDAAVVVVRSRGLVVDARPVAAPVR